MITPEAPYGTCEICNRPLIALLNHNEEEIKAGILHVYRCPLLHTATEAILALGKRTKMISTETLSKSFYTSSGKTLKLEVKPETKLVEAVEDSRKYLETQDCPHSRIEFKFGHCYIVIARLRN